MDKLSKENQELSVELDRWIDDNTVDGDFICHPDFIYDKLLEMESKLKQANEFISEIGSSIKDCFPNPQCSCDGVLLVSIESYNKLVELYNQDNKQ